MPFSVVVDVYFTPVAWLVATTVTPGTAAPDGSVTCPVKVPRSDCAQTKPPADVARNTQSRTLMSYIVSREAHIWRLARRLGRCPIRRMASSHTMEGVGLLRRRESYVRRRLDHPRLRHPDRGHLGRSRPALPRRRVRSPPRSDARQGQRLLRRHHLSRPRLSLHLDRRRLGRRRRRPLLNRRYRRRSQRYQFLPEVRLRPLVRPPPARHA